ncbi:hemoblobin-interacting domain-containing protein [Paenibacillus sp. CMAA1364]
MLRRVSISLLAALLVLSSFSFSSIASAEVTPSSEWIPTYKGSELDGNSSLRIYFEESMSVTSATYLKAQMTIATDGVNFVTLPEQSNVNLYGNRINLNYNFEMPIVQGLYTKIKIAAGTLNNGDGIYNSELILDVAPPAIQGAVISNFNHDVTITFHEDVYDNRISNSVSRLKEYIYIQRDGASSSDYLATSDTVSLASDKLTIHFAQALTGANNQIIIGSHALKDSNGNIITDSIVTPMISAVPDILDPNPVDRTAPKFIKAYITNADHDIVLEFDEAVLNNKDTIDNLKASIYYQYYTNGLFSYNAPSNLTYTFSGNTLIIHSPQPLNGQYHLNFQQNSFKDASGNIYTDSIYTGWLYSIQQLSPQSGSITKNGRLLNLMFYNNQYYRNINIFDNTLVAGVSHLKEKISISTDGINFSPLSEQDVVSIQENRLVVLLQDPITNNNSIMVKIAADALTDEYKNLQNLEVSQWIGYNVPDLTGFLYSNLASELTFEDNELWRSKVTSVTIEDEDNGATRTLSSSEYTLTAGMLTINKGVFQNGIEYEVYIHADGYSSRYIENVAVKSSEVFYMTAPVITTANGLTAKINIFNSFQYKYGNYDSIGTQSVIFQLMKDNTPVSIVEANLMLHTGTYSASFNVADPTNPAYTVKAFLVSKFNNDFTSVGVNLATKVTQTQMDLFLNEYYYNN